MFKRIFSLITVVFMLCQILPCAAADSETIYISQGFGAYAENQTSVGGLSFVSGLDTRVINDAGDKVLFSRALGDSVKIKIPLQLGDNGSTVFSAKIKLGGNKTTGKIFSISAASSKFDALTIAADSYIKLTDKKIVSGVNMDTYKTYTMVINWDTGLYDVYVDKKCMASGWKIPDSFKPEAVKDVSFTLDYNDKLESCLYIDNLRIYSGNKLPWRRSFPSEGFSNEVLEFVSSEGIEEKITLIKTVEFNGNTSGAQVQNKTAATIAAEVDDDGTQYVHFYADANTPGGAYIDINAVDVENYNKYVVDMRVKIFEFGNQASLGFFDGKNQAGTWRKGFTLSSNGAVTSRYSGAKLTTIPIGEWTRLTFCYNIPSGKVEIYQNGEYIAVDTCSDSMFVQFFRFDLVNKEGSVHNCGIDYVKIYSGNTPMAESEQSGSKENYAGDVDMGITVMDSPSMASKVLGNATVLMTNCNNIYLNGKKTTYPDENMRLAEINSKPMINEALLSFITDCDAVYDSASNSVKINQISYSLLEQACQYGGKWYMSLDEIAQKVLNKKLTWDDRGCATIADVQYYVQRDHYTDRHIQFHDSDVIYRYMQFDNPSGYEMIDKLSTEKPGNEHPRLLWTMDDVEYILEKISNDSEWKRAYDTLMADAAKELEADNSDYYNADKNAKQNASSKMQDAITDLARAYLLTGKPEYAKKGIEIMEGFAAWDTLDYNTANLISGHWMATIAIGYDSFYNYLVSVPGGIDTIDKVKKAALNLAFVPHYEAYRGTVQEPHYITMQDNFSGVCGGGLSSLLIAMGDEEEMRDIMAYLFENNMKTLQVAANLFYPNGGYYESVGYAQYMCTNLGIALVGMKNSFDTYYGLDLAKGFTDFGYAHTYLQSTDTNVNYHDGSPGYVYDSLREKWAYLFDIPEQAALARRQKLLMNRKATIDDLFFYCRATDGKLDDIDLDALGTDRYFYGNEAGAFTSSMEVSNPTFVGFHGGLTDIPHDMLDLGQFVFESDNIKWATDLDSDKYSLPGYFGENGYNLYRKRPEGENCIVLNPATDPSYYGQKLGARAELVMLDINKPRGAMAAYDLTDPYSRDADKYVRGYYFGDDRNTLIVQDELELKGNTEFYWFMQTAQEIEILSNTQARLKNANGKTLLVDVYCSDPDYTLISMAAKPLPSSPVFEGQDENIGYRKLAVHAPSMSGKVTVAVKLSPENNRYDYSGLNPVPINEWSIPDGNPLPTPKLLKIMCNGIAIGQSVAGSEEVVITLPFGTTEVPVISAEADMGKVDIIQAESLENYAQITVSGDGMRTTKVKVRFTVSMERPIYITDELSSAAPVIGLPDNVINPVFADAQSPEDTNGPENLIDNDLGSRCAQKGDNVWFEVDLGKAMDINGIVLGFYLGAKRQTYFDALYSEDGINYKRVFTGSSTGGTEEYETLAIPGRVRYIRILGNGTSEGNKWSSITEIKAY